MNSYKQDTYFNRTPLQSMNIPWAYHVDHREGSLMEPCRFSFHFDCDAGYSRHFSYLPFQGQMGLCDYSMEPAFIRKRNERERQRVRCVNEGYAQLRKHLPQDLAEKRLSKVETLRAAIGYIKRLRGLLDLESLGTPPEHTGSMLDSIPHAREEGGNPEFCDSPPQCLPRERITQTP